VERALRKAGVEHDTVRQPLRRRDRDAVVALTGQRSVPVVVFDGEEPVADSRRIVEHLAWRAAQLAPPAGS
jgi:glutathione S-transferase